MGTIGPGPAAAPELAALFVPLCEGKVSALAVFHVAGNRVSGHLHESEASLIRSAVPHRQREFTAGRVCARAAMTEIGSQPQPILVGDQRAPRWPLGLIGSITHTGRDEDAYCAAVVAKLADGGGGGSRVGVGIDAELVQPLEDGVRDLILTGAELATIADLDHDDRERAIVAMFSAKEAFYKAQYAITDSWVDFHDIEVSHPRNGGPLRLSPVGDNEALRRIGLPMECHQIVRNGLIVSAVVVSEA